MEAHLVKLLLVTNLKIRCCARIASKFQVLSSPSVERQFGISELTKSYLI